MKQPDTSALRERLNNYTPGQELEKDKQELEGLLLEVNCQIAELRNLLKEINELKEELHGIHGSLMHTAKRERAAFNALDAAKDSAYNIVNGSCNAIVKAERHTVIQANWQMYTNVPLPISRRRKNFWKSTEPSWPSIFATMKVSGFPTDGSQFCLSCNSSVILRWHCGC